MTDRVAELELPSFVAAACETVLRSPCQFIQLIDLGIEIRTLLYPLSIRLPVNKETVVLFVWSSFCDIRRFERRRYSKCQVCPLATELSNFELTTCLLPSSTAYVLLQQSDPQHVVRKFKFHRSPIHRLITSSVKRHRRVRHRLSP